ncbi:hypothetical protein ACIGCP_15995 [Cellulophaga baltica]|uniref:hypothetical protein n=1 Tax=Cellulophaga baltica TaxID=76594 RepID=UPI0037C57E1E
MINDIKNSFSKILNERITSPFYGTLFISWLIWNWKVIYLTLFIDEKTIEKDKISYIIENFSDLNYLITYPLVSTVILILIAPFASNGAYWISLRFNQWKINKRNEVQKKELLTLEQSINLREQIKSQEKRFEELLEDKNLRIKQLETEIEFLKKSENVSEEQGIDNSQKEVEQIKNKEVNSIAMLINDNEELTKTFDTLSTMALHKYTLKNLNESSKPKNKSMNFFLANRIVEQDINGRFSFTDYGKEIAKNILNNKL